MKPSDLLTPAQAAEALGLSAPHVRRLIEAGTLPARRMGPRTLLVSRRDVERERQRRIKASLLPRRRGGQVRTA